MQSRSTIALECLPILEWLLGNQPGARNFNTSLEDSVATAATLPISRINCGEVLYMLSKKLSAQKLSAARIPLSLLPLQIVSVDDKSVNEAVGIKSTHSLSYADGFAAPLKIRMNAPVVTGDREFLRLQVEDFIRLEWLGA